MSSHFMKLFIRISYKWRFLILTCIAHIAYGQDSYQEFETIPLNDLLVVNCFVQDPLGMIWIGADKGLYSYDGYVSRKISIPSDFPKGTSSIHCSILFDEEHIWLGSENGIVIYNFRTDEYEMPPVDIPFDVRSMLLWNDVLWIGSINGLYQYHTISQKMERVDDPGIPHQTIYSIVRSDDGIIYIGTYDGLCCYTPSTGSYEKIDLPAVTAGKANLFVNSLLYDSVRHCIWVGIEGALFKYDPTSRIPERINRLDGNIIKSMALDHDHRLLLGTDNGLYIYNEDNWQHIVHDSRYVQSLFNSIVWSIFIDKRKNVWLGTTGGISLYHYNKVYQVVPVSQLTGIGDGNSFSTVYRDSRHNFWLGGTGGLIRIPNIAWSAEATAWYRMGDEHFPISHNQVRDIYEDADQNLWIATDGSINRFDYGTKQLIHSNIVDSTQRFNANWAQSLQEDNQGRLWIATWMGGIFVVDKAELMRTTGMCTAKYHFSRENGLIDNNVRKITRDHSGQIWAVCKGICKIQPETGSVVKVPLYNDKHEEILPLPTLMLCDSEDYLWVAVQGGVCRIDPKTDESIFIRFEILEDEDIHSMVEKDNHIWFSSSDGMILLEKKLLDIEYFDLIDKNLSGGFYDRFSGNLYFGMVDGIAVFSSDLATASITGSPLYLTMLYINEKPFKSSGSSIRYVKSIELEHNQNNITLEFSNLLYSPQFKKLIYRMEGIDNNWRVVKPGSNRVSYTLLPPGKYRFSICSLDANGNPSDTRYEFVMLIHPPWYYSFWAKCIYVVLLCGLVLWAINYFRVRHRLKIERIEKEKSLELSKLKIDFFTDISHEFKTPLSLIIAPVSKLILEAKTPQLKKDLRMIEQNALHLNTLINQAINFQRVETNQSLIRSTVEIVKFVKKIFDSYESIFIDKQLDARFDSNIENLYIEIDILKMESVLNNLLSNACKYTPNSGSVKLTLTCEETSKQLEITVFNSGSNIPQNEMPYIFDRFFQSRSTREKGGTGIGLYLVKNYIELHGGTVMAQSDKTAGTAFTVRLPVLTNEMAGHSVQSGSTDDKDKPLILVIDDNYQIAEFISQFLGKHYRVATAYDGKSGLDLCLKIAPDLVIADVMMPGMNGLDMCRQIRKHTPFTTTPIILLTAKDDAETERESVEIGIECFIAKPFDVQLLLSRIRQLTGKHRQMEEKIRIEALSTPAKVEVTSVNEQFLTKVTQIIEDRIADPDLNVNALSSLAGVDSKQLYRKIKHLTGRSPVEYIKFIRVKKAAVLLSQKKFSVAEVMYLVGFSNHSYFSKCFQEEFGKTPKQFMEET